MKKNVRCRLYGVVLLALALTACSGAGQTELATEGVQNQETHLEESQKSTEKNEDDANTDAKVEVEADTNGESSDGSDILIVYFSIPEAIDLDGVDANSGASVVVQDGEALGNVQYMAQIIQKTTGGDMFRIETVQQYPQDHDPLVDQAAEEQDEEARPELAAHLENADQYNVVFLGYPNWWGDLPMPLYTFLEETDLSGKTIIPFCPHGGSGFSRTEATIASLQPDAQVSENGFSISRDDVVDSNEQVIDWVESLGL